MGINCDHLDEGKLIFSHPACPAFCMILHNTSCSNILTHQSNVGNHSHSRKNVIQWQMLFLQKLWGPLSPKISHEMSFCMSSQKRAGTLNPSLK